MSVVAGIIATKSNDAVLHKTERGPARSTHSRLCQLPADELVTEAV